MLLPEKDAYFSLKKSIIIVKRQTWFLFSVSLRKSRPSGMDGL